MKAKENDNILACKARFHYECMTVSKNFLHNNAREDNMFCTTSVFFPQQHSSFYEN